MWTSGAGPSICAFDLKHLRNQGTRKGPWVVERGPQQSPAGGKMGSECCVRCFTLLVWGRGTVPHKSHTEAYSYLWFPGLSLPCFLSAFLKLKLTWLSFTSGLLSFSISGYLSLLLSPWLGSRVAGPWRPPLLVLLLLSLLPDFSYLHSACRPLLPLLLLCYWPFISLLQPSGVQTSKELQLHG